MSGDAVVVIGAGMAGMGAAHQLNLAGLRARVYDRSATFGGHTASFELDGRYTVDDGPHISFTRNERLRDLFAAAVDDRLHEVRATVDNWFEGHRPRHPVQANLHGLPSDLVVRCIADFVRASTAPPPERAATYEAWLRAALGDTIAETFPMVYGRKYHTVEAARMSTDWLGPRIYRPSLEEVLRGALEPDAGDVHYVTTFRYPQEGGFVRFLEPFREQADVHLAHDVVEVDPGRRRISFAGGRQTGYDQLISTAPLPVLVPMVVGAPPDVVRAASRLACTRCVLVTLLVDREDLSDAHWTYVYDPGMRAVRLSYPHMFAPANTPPGTGAVQVEVYYSDKYAPLDHPPEDDVEPVIAELQQMGVLREGDRILHRTAWEIPWANVIFDLDRADALSAVHGFLDEVGIIPAGRYGMWGYLWTDQAFASGEQAARRAMDALGRRRPAALH